MRTECIQGLFVKSEHPWAHKLGEVTMRPCKFSHCSTMTGNHQLPRKMEMRTPPENRINRQNIGAWTFCSFINKPLSYSHSQVGKIRKTAARRREYRILFMVLTTAACYLLCWMPYGVVAMMATFGPPNIISPIASVVPSLLAKSSTVINPLIYILMNKQVSHQVCACVVFLFFFVVPKLKVIILKIKDNLTWTTALFTQ